VVALATFSTTGTLIGLPVAPADAIVTVPVYCPAVNVAPFTVTETAPGAVPLAGVAFSQVPPVAVVKVTVNGSPAGFEVTLRVWAAGEGPPAIWLKLSVVLGDTESEPAVTVAVTLIVWLLPGVFTVIAPV